MALLQQLGVAQALLPSVVLILKPKNGKCAELFCLQMSLCHVLNRPGGAVQGLGAHGTARVLL